MERTFLSIAVFYTNDNEIVPTAFRIMFSATIACFAKSKNPAHNANLKQLIFIRLLNILIKLFQKSLFSQFVHDTIMKN